MKKVGRYEIISELGRGAMGIVYRASDPTIGREVALKVLTLNDAPGEGTNSPQEMFMREVRAAGRLAHPSIVTIHDAFEDMANQTSCIVMEMVPGVTLEKILDSDHPPTIEQSLDLVRQVAEALDYAHRNQVIHRDLKPANILVTMDDRIKITDFGIAKVLAREGVARTIGVMGTPSYMSPEQVRGSDIDARSDIFSLGIIIFTMLTGKKPFSGNTAAVMFKIVYEESQLPSTLNPQLTSAHDYLVRKCLAKDRNERYSSARELLGDLDDLQHDRPLRSRGVVPAFAPAVAPPAVAIPRPAPPPPHVVTPPKPVAHPFIPPAETEAPLTPQVPGETMAMPIPGLMKGMSSPPREAVPSKPVAPPPIIPEKADGLISPPVPGQTMAMPIPGLMKGMSPLPPRTVPPPPVSPPVPVQPPKAASPFPITRATDQGPQPLTGQTLPMRAPDLSAYTPSAPASPPVPPWPPVSHEPMIMEPMPPLQGLDRSTTPPAVEARPDTFAPPLQPDGEIAVQPADAAGEVLPPPKSKLIPIMFAGVTVILLAAVIWGYWRIHRSRTAPAPPPQVAVQTQPEAPPAPAPTPVEPPTPPPAAAVEQPAIPASAAGEVAKKNPVHRPKLSKVSPQPAPAPEPTPAQPEPVAAPLPNPVAPTPSPEEIARAEAARLASIPRIIQVLCNYGLKEATFVFSAGGKALYEGTLKGTKKKGGFLGIKGSYQGTFTHTITVPAGVSEVSVRVLTKDGGTDVTKAVKMPPAGGFVPTLTVQVDADHMALNWQGSPGTK